MLDEWFRSGLFDYSNDTGGGVCIIRLIMIVLFKRDGQNFRRLKLEVKLLE